MNSEGWGAQMRSFSRGSDGLAEICEEDAAKVIIPLLNDEVRNELLPVVSSLQKGFTSVNSVVRSFIKSSKVNYNEPRKRPSHIVLV
jgi:type I restriction enzyme M protein